MGFRNYKKHSAYNWGRMKEKEAIKMMRDMGYDVVKASAEDDKKYDIDVWVDDGIPVSIKAVRERNFNLSQSLLFEFEVFDRDYGWQDSWLRTGQSRYYVILIDGPQPQLYAINKAKLRVHINHHGWDDVKGLKLSTKRK